MIDFNGSTLYISLRSPFARRVRLAFRENDIKYEEKVVDVFNPPPGFEKLNPLQRIPILLLKTGESIIDSNSILLGFYESYKNSPLISKNEHDRVTTLKWSGIALGICETLVQRYLETLKPKENQDQDTLAEQKQIFLNSLTEFEEFIGDKAFISESGLTQADLDMGTALAYLALRYDSRFAEKYPKTAFYFKRLNERPSFLATNPPPAT